MTIVYLFIFFRLLFKCYLLIEAFFVNPIKIHSPWLCLLTLICFTSSIDQQIIYCLYEYVFNVCIFTLEYKLHKNKNFVLFTAAICPAIGSYLTHSRHLINTIEWVHEWIKWLSWRVRQGPNQTKSCGPTISLKAKFFRRVG